jgi:hypothetical protein
MSSVPKPAEPVKGESGPLVESAAVARKSLRPQLNQIRAWVRQGRTDAWIAHQLEVSASQLRDFRRRHGLTGEGEEPAADLDLRDEIEAEIEAELSVEPEAEAEEEEEGATDEGEGDSDEGDRDEGENGERPAGRKRRRRRGGRGRGRKKALEATFDQGEEEGYGIWLDPSVKENPTYAEHWAGHKALKVTIEPERIVLERADD